MIAVNEQISGIVDPTNPNTAAVSTTPMGTSPKLVVAIDGSTRDEVEGQQARQMALTRAAKEGFADGGLSNPPTIVPLDAAGQPIREEDSFKAGTQVGGFRAEFMFNGR